jgi:threonine/homoserine/homoserine lactone efflux protein
VPSSPRSRSCGSFWRPWRRPGSAGWRCSSGARGPGGSPPGEDAPWGVLRAVLFQWVNPKVWAITLAAASGYGLGLSPLEEAQRLALAFSGINLFVCLFWAFAGSLLSTLLTDDRAWTIFTRVMATGLAVSAVMVFV